MASKTVKLNSGFEAPLLALGTWQSSEPEKLKAAVKAAIEAGYRHIDTAQSYANEHIIGEALQELYDGGKIKREELFITTKLFATHFKPELVLDQLKKQMAALKTTYLDLYLMHFPAAMQKDDNGQPLMANGEVVFDEETKFEDTYAKLEEAVKLGLVRSIGVSNFNVNQLERLKVTAKIPPAANQVEMQPFFQNKKLVDYCKKQGIVIMAYSSFGSPGTTFGGRIFCPIDVLADERIVAIGKKYGKTSAQTILRWLTQQNIIALPKSVTPSRIVENANFYDFTLKDEDMAAIAGLDLDKRNCVWAFPGLDKHKEYPFIGEGSC